MDFSKIVQKTLGTIVTNTMNCKLQRLCFFLISIELSFLVYKNTKYQKV